jgi:hypothetical protein
VEGRQVDLTMTLPGRPETTSVSRPDSIVVRSTLRPIFYWLGWKKVWMEKRQVDLTTTEAGRPDVLTFIFFPVSRTDSEKYKSKDVVSLNPDMVRST